MVWIVISNNYCSITCNHIAGLGVLEWHDNETLEP